MHLSVTTGRLIDAKLREQLSKCFNRRRLQLSPAACGRYARYVATQKY